MANSNGKITAPVRIIQDLCPVLGTGYTDLGKIITTASINRWAKCKPFKSSALMYASDSARATACAAANYGLIYPSQRSLSSWATAITDTYIYSRPRGGGYSEQFRLLDFVNYNHNAPAPIRNFNNASIEIPYDSKSIALMVTTTSTDGLTIGDVFTGTWYLGILFSKDNWTTTYIVTSSNTLANGANTVVVPNQLPFNVTASTTVSDVWQMRCIAVDVSDTGTGSGGAKLITSETFSLAHCRALPFESVSVNAATLTVKPKLRAYFRMLQTTSSWTSESVWELNPRLSISQTSENTVTMTVTGIKVTHEGTDTTYAVRNEVTFTIQPGSTTPEITPASMSQSSFYSSPLLRVGDVVQLVGSVTPANRIDVSYNTWTVSGN